MSKADELREAFDRRFAPDFEGIVAFRAALDVLIEAAKAEERERCAKVAEIATRHGQDVADEIRGLK